MDNIYITTSVRLTKEQYSFFKEENIKMSPEIRDLIDGFEKFKRWKDGKV